jgi:hypothetical protein
MPAVAPGIANRVWTIGDLLDAALAEPPGCELNLYLLFRRPYCSEHCNSGLRSEDERE